MKINLPPSLNAEYRVGSWDDAIGDFQPGTISICFGDYDISEIRLTEIQDYRCREQQDESRQSELEEIVGEWLREKLSVDGKGAQSCSECWALVPVERMPQHYRAVHP